MTVKDKSTIKSYFQTGDKPSADDFGDLIDSYQDANTILNYIATASPNFAAGTFFGANGSGAAYIDRNTIRVSAGVVKIPSLGIAAIDGTPIGSTSPSTGAFTTVSANSVNAGAATFTGTVSANTMRISGTLTTNELKVNGTVSASSAYFNNLQSGQIVDYHSLYIRDVVADDYDIVNNSPYAYTITQFRGKTNDGNCTTLFKKNGTTFFTQVFASGSTAISTSQSFVAGDKFSVTVSAVSGAVSGLSIYAKHTRAL